MSGNPFLGVLFHWLGGLASGSFYVPYRGVKKWSWEVYWLVGGFFSWIIAPWILASIMTKDLFAVIGGTDPHSLFWAYFWGAMWGLGGLTFGLTMRYLGMSLGMAVALGYCTVFGTLVPPIYKGNFVTEILQTNSGLVTMIGIVICLLGIAIAGLAGMSKEREMDEEQKQSMIKEFNFKKGILVATFSGIFSASMAFAIAAADPIDKLSIEHGTSVIWKGLPALCIILLGGFTSNFIWCVFLNIKNKTGYQYFSPTLRRPSPLRGEETILENAVDAPSEEMVEHIPAAKQNGGNRVPMLANYLFSALAGVTWYMQFFFYTMGKSQMGEYDFSSWTLHMASIIIFSSLWGIALLEWKGSSGFTKSLLALGLASLVFSTVIVGYGNYLVPTSFEMKLCDAKIGELPKGWSTAKTGKGSGSDWSVVEDYSAFGGKALAQTSAEGPKPLFNLCIAEETSFADTDIYVSLKANAGKIDQGGGPIWRCQDADNYYLARWNPLEYNIRVYKVEKGKRTQLGTADVKLPSDIWHVIRVVQKGNSIRCYLDGKQYIEVQDETFAKAGNIGLWSKADAQTSFAELKADGKIKEEQEKNAKAETPAKP